MTVVGVLTLVAGVRESYSLAGLTSGVVGFGSAVFGPFVGAAADKWGQRIVMSACAIANTAFLLAIVWLAYAGDGVIMLLVAAFLTGASAPQVGPLARARWLALIPKHLPGHRAAKPLSAAMSYESMADELVFVLGPVLVGVLAWAVSPGTPVIVAAGVVFVFVGWLALHRTANEAHIENHRAAGPARSGKLLTIRVLLPAFGMTAIGLFFGSTLTALTAFMGDFGQEPKTGILYGAMGVGSAICALAVAALPERFELRQRWIAAAALPFVASLIYPWIGSIGAMIPALVLAGVGIGPSLVTLFSIGSKVAPVGKSTTVMTMLSTGVVIGQAIASTVTGTIVQTYDARAGFFTVIVATGLLAALAGLGLAVYRPRQAR
nr:MFS transporter [Spelaeicoccus albus]